MRTEQDRDYAVQILNLRTYDAVSRDIIQRWVYPFVPDKSVTPSQMCDPGYQYLRGNIYRQEGLNIARSATIGNNSVLATGCR
jgi:translation initiation factor eIF-2B subunit epsilon